MTTPSLFLPSRRAHRCTLLDCGAALVSARPMIGTFSYVPQKAVETALHEAYKSLGEPPQANEEEMLAKEHLDPRLRLRFDPEISRRLALLWACHFSGTVFGAPEIDKATFCQTHQLITRCLFFPTLATSTSLTAAYEDWDQGRRYRFSMTQLMFQDVIWELVDTWTVTVRQQEYVHFLDCLIMAITRPRLRVPRAKPQSLLLMAQFLSVDVDVWDKARQLAWVPFKDVKFCSGLYSGRQWDETKRSGVPATVPTLQSLQVDERIELTEEYCRVLVKTTWAFPKPQSGVTLKWMLQEIRGITADKLARGHRDSIWQYLSIKGGGKATPVAHYVARLVFGCAEFSSKHIEIEIFARFLSGQWGTEMWHGFCQAMHLILTVDPENKPPLDLRASRFMVPWSLCLAVCARTLRDFAAVADVEEIRMYRVTEDEGWLSTARSLSDEPPPPHPAVSEPNVANANPKYLAAYENMLCRLWSRESKRGTPGAETSPSVPDDQDDLAPAEYLRPLLAGGSKILLPKPVPVASEAVLAEFAQKKTGHWTLRLGDFLNYYCTFLLPRYHVQNVPGTYTWTSQQLILKWRLAARAALATLKASGKRLRPEDLTPEYIPEAPPVEEPAADESEGGKDGESTTPQGEKDAVGGEEAEGAAVAGGDFGADSDEEQPDKLANPVTSPLDDVLSATGGTALMSPQSTPRDVPLRPRTSESSVRDTAAGDGRPRSTESSRGRRDDGDTASGWAPSTQATDVAAVSELTLGGASKTPTSYEIQVRVSHSQQDRGSAVGSQGARSVSSGGSALGSPRRTTPLKPGKVDPSLREGSVAAAIAERNRQKALALRNQPNPRATRFLREDMPWMKPPQLPQMPLSLPVHVEKRIDLTAPPQSASPRRTGR
mmetsp:Transcript_20020/g.46782  ORF Transcript_20020/g.46782 Transcript_20020/m.46782 type:complete len:887 (+) Transcript_20020:163-2823(+)